MSTSSNKFIIKDITNFINSYLFLILLIFFSIIHLSLIFGNKKYLKFSNFKRKQIILWFSIVLLISNIIFISTFLIREIYDNFKWSFGEYFIFNYAELCTFLGFFGAIILIICSSLSMTNYEEIVTVSSSLSMKKEKNNSKRYNLIIESIGPWMMLGGLFTMLVSQTYFTDPAINPGSKKVMLQNIAEFFSLIDHTILFNLGIFIIYSKISKYTKENYMGVYGFIIAFIGYIILAAGIPYAITGYIGFSNASTAFLPSHPGSAYYDIFNIFYNQGIPHPIVLLLFWGVCCTSTLFLTKIPQMNNLILQKITK